MLSQYIPVLVTIGFGLAFAGLFLAGAVLLGPKRETPIKQAPFECGSDPIGSPRGRFSVKFYQVAILFLIFDIESAFLYPWAVNFREFSRAADGGASFFAVGVMLTFLAILLVGLVYVWRKKAVGWD
jgi:NADH-quinone oxidoreductase subunit A